MKNTGRNLLGLAISGLLLLGGCGSASVADNIARTVGEDVLRSSGDDALRSANSATLREIIAGRVRSASGLQSEAALARVGEPVSISALRNATGSARSLRAEFDPKLDNADVLGGVGKAIDLGGAVVQAHCSGLKKELDTGVPTTTGDYLIYLGWAVLEAKLPTPPGKQLQGTAENLVKIQREVRSRTSHDEATRRAYIKERCAIK